MNRNIKKMLREYKREFTYQKAPDALKQKLNLVPKETYQDRPVLWRTLAYVGTAVVCVSVALPLGYMLGDKGIIGTPQTTCDTIAAAEAYLIAVYDDSLRTPVLTFFSQDQYQVSLYFAIDDGQNHCFYVIVTEHDDVRLTFVNASIPLFHITSTTFGSFVIQSDALTSFRMELKEDSVLIDQWNVDFDIPAYLDYI